MIQLLHARDEKRLDALCKKYGRLLKSIAYGILRSGESLPLDELAEYISGGGAPQRKRADAPAEQLPDG